MKCLDNIYTKQLKYNSPVLYQLESLKKEYEKLLKKYNEIIQIENEIEECYFETNSAIYSNESVSFIGKINVKTDKGFYSNIDSIIKLNMKGSGEIVVDIDEENKSLMFKIDEEFLSEITLMMEKLDSLTDDFNSLKEKFESQIFDNLIGIRNTADSKIDQIKHINNNFQITSSDGKSLLNIDEQLETISSFNKNILTSDDLEILEEVEVVYDVSSADINLNWGYTSGINNGTVFTKDLSKYKRLIFYFENFPNGGICEIDNGYGSSVNQEHGIVYSTQNDQGFLYVYLFKVKRTDNSYQVYFTRYRQNDANQNSSGVVYKIEGVIK